MCLVYKSRCSLLNNFTSPPRKTDFMASMPQKYGYEQLDGAQTFMKPSEFSTFLDKYANEMNHSMELLSDVS